MSAPLRITKLRPGDLTDTHCGRCKVERAHQVVALNEDGRPATVICRTCGGQHRFREKKEAVAPSAASGERRRAVRSAGRTPDAPSGPPRPYSPKEIYSEGEWVDHPTFGQGKVSQSRAGKIEVRFETGSRLLLHAG